MRCRAAPPDAGAALRERTVDAARRFRPRLRAGEAVSHTSALLLHGCPIRTDDALHVSSQPGHDRNRTRGVVGHRLGSATEIERIDGVPTLPPIAALLQSAAILPLSELVVAIDHLIRPRGPHGRIPPRLEPDRLRREAAQHRGRGSQRLRLAIKLARVGSESRMETLTRLVLLAFGLDHWFQLQVEISDASGWIGRFDLVCRKRRIILEFDGDQHRTSRTQYERDLRRLDRARAAGYLVIRLLGADVLHRPEATARRIAAALGVQTRRHPRCSELLVAG